MEHKAAWKPLTKALKSKGVRNERRKRKKSLITFHLSMTRCGSVVFTWAGACVAVCLLYVYASAHETVCRFTCMYALVHACCVCARSCLCVCYAWRHTRSNRVVVDSDSCPVPFTAQSFQPPLCSVRLLMRINVLWRPMGLPYSPPTAQLMKKYNLAKILRWRERATQTENDWVTAWEGKTREKLRANKQIAKGNMQKPEGELWGR